MLVKLLKVVSVRASEVVRFAHSLLSLYGVKNSKSDIVGKDWLDLSIHALDDEVHSIEHFHLNSPFGGNVPIWVDVVHHHGWSQDGHVWESVLNLLLADPLGS